MVRPDSQALKEVSKLRFSQSLRQEAFAKAPLYLVQRYACGDKALILEMKAPVPRGCPLLPKTEATDAAPPTLNLSS